MYDTSNHACDLCFLAYNFRPCRFVWKHSSRQASRSTNSREHHISDTNFAEVLQQPSKISKIRHPLSTFFGLLFDCYSSFCKCVVCRTGLLAIISGLRMSRLQDFGRGGRAARRGSWGRPGSKYVA